MAMLSAMAAFADIPTVTNVVAKQRYPWNGLVDITCEVRGITESTEKTWFALAAKPEAGSGETRKISNFWVVENGVQSSDRSVRTNGNYRLLWDARADLGQKVYTNMTVEVSLSVPKGVQLWENGPYWAEMNIGADEPWDYGYYFWWGDTIGYKRENNKWVASDGSNDNFSFTSSNASTYSKGISTLQNEGYTKDGVLAPKYDAAQKQWHGNWRMPTKTELSNLKDNCDRILVTTNGIVGCVFQGKADGYKSASIFLPVAGADVMESFGEDGTKGYYWSSEPSSSGTANSGTFVISISSFGLMASSDSFRRYYGFSIRPVQTTAAAVQTTPTESAPFYLDTMEGTRTARDVETITYSPSWVTNAPTDAVAVVTVNGEILPTDADKDEVAWSPVRAGMFALTNKVMSGGTQYGETLTATFNVLPKDFSLVKVDVDLSDVTYCGTALTPPVTSVTWNGNALALNTGYTLAYSNNVNAGTATITLTGTNLYYGTYTTNFTINPKPLSATMVGVVDDVVYNGSAYTPEPDITDTERSVQLAKGTDYTFSYTNNTEAGTATVTVTGMGNYSESVQKTFTIAPHDIAGAAITLGDALTYNGQGQKQQISTVTVDGLTVVYVASDDEATDVGEYTLTLTGTNNFTGTVTTTFSIAPKSIDGATVTLSDSLVYSGSLQTQGVESVTIDGLYATFAVSNNSATAAGQYALTVTGNGNFTGVVTNQFEVAPKPLALAMVGDVGPFTYEEGTAYTPEPTVTDAERGVALVKETDYTLSYTNNTLAGDATVTVTGIGNYTNSVPKLFTIAKKAVEPPTIASSEYSGELQQASVPTSTLYGVEQNAGGIGVGGYEVTLRLVDSSNYTWPNVKDADLTLKFWITRATNAWITAPSISGWVYGQTPSEPNLGVARFGSATVAYSSTPMNTGDYTSTFTVMETANYTELSEVVPFTITSAEEEALKKALGGLPVTIGPDGTGGWTVTITNDIDVANLPIVIPDDVGHVTLDLNGHDLLGTDGKDGSPAILIVPGSVGGEVTRLTLVTAGGDSLVKGGDGGAGNTGGNGAPAVQAAEGAQAGIKIDIGAGVTVQGGRGDADSPAIIGAALGVNQGRLVRARVEVPDVPSVDYTGAVIDPQVPTSALYSVSAPSEVRPGSYPVTMTLLDSVMYEWVAREGATVNGAVAVVNFVIVAVLPKIETEGGAKSGRDNPASVVAVYDGAGHSISVKVTNPPSGAKERYARTAAGPFTDEKPVFTNATEAAETWYELSAAGFESVTNMATVTISPRSLATASLGSLRFESSGGVRTPVPVLVDDLGHEVPLSDYDFAWTEETSGAMTLSFTGRGNYIGLFERRLAQTRFHVTFDPAGGIVGEDGADYDIGTYYGVLPVPSRAGYIFGGWYEHADFSGEPVTRNTEVIAADLTLHAKWQRRVLWYTDAVFHLEEAAKYDGYLIDPAAGDAVAGTVNVKAGKPNRKTGVSKLTITLLVAGQKKVTVKGSTYDGSFKADGQSLALSLGFSSMTGTFGRYVIDGSRNVFAAKDAESKMRAAQALNKWRGSYVVAWQTPGMESRGWNGLSLDVGAKGVVKAKGSLADGTAVSAKSQMLVGERECAIAVSWTKKTSSVACLVWLCEDGSVECGNLMGGAYALIENARTGAFLDSGAALRLDRDALAAMVPGLMPDLLPDGLAVRMKGTAFDVDKPGKVKLLKDKSGIDPAGLGTNPSGLKLKYKMKEATFSGTFTAYSLAGGKLKKTRVQVSGVVLGGKGYGTAAIKKVGSTVVNIR